MSEEIKNMDDLLNELSNSKAALKDLQGEEKSLKQAINELESRIILNLENQGVDRIGNDVCTVSIKKDVVPTVEDWDLVHQHIIDNGQFELLQKECQQPPTESFNKWDRMFQVLSQRSLLELIFEVSK